MTAPSLADLTRVFGRIGLLSFGGPAAQIALMHRELVERRAWLGEDDFLRALSFCMLLPGPEAMQLATYAGWRIAGTAGGLIAGLLFVLPGAALVLALAIAYGAYGDMPLAGALLLGVKACVVAIVIEALVKVARRALTGRAQRIIAVLAFGGLFALTLPFPAIVLAAGAWGFLTARGAPADTAPAPRPGHLWRPVAIWTAVWLLPLGALWLVERGILAQIGLYFSQLAVLTFGGAYAVLAWMAQTVVQDFGWLTAGQMIDALGLAETTPGPLILVTQFVGYLAAEKSGGVALGVAGAAVALWMTFAPCFLWIFAGAPWVEHLTSRVRPRAALAAITAAVVGVIANLSLWFAIHVFFAQVIPIPTLFGTIPMPDPTSLQPLPLAIAGLASALILWRKWPLIPVLVLCAAISAAATLA